MVSKTPAKSAAPEKESAKKPAATKAAAKTAPAKAAPVKAVAEAPSKPSTPKAAPAKTPVAAAAPARAGHAPAPSTASFTDRFAPPKPSTKTYPEPMNAVKAAAKADPKLASAWKTKAGRDLTEAELLAMPESEYMNDKQLEFFRSRLQEQKDALLSNAGETTEHLREDTSIVPDPADRATIEEEHALELRTRDRERKLLKKISQSLARIEAGDYGYCDETGEPIGLGRLLARPTATLSLEAQQRREMKQKMFGD
ncbi:MAG: RNA polymerase-binding protein DksA [Burkholderiaceae bacterium]